MEFELVPQERDTLQMLSEQAKPRYVRRARVILGWADGLPLEAVGEQAGLSLRRVRYWLREFQDRRMAVFPKKPLDDLASGVEEDKKLVSAPETPLEEEPAKGVSVQALCAEYGVDPAHARHVADLALQLYDLTQEVHALEPFWRSLLENAALLIV